MRRLRHRNIVQLLGAFRVTNETGGCAWFLMQELVTGGDVFDAVNFYSFTEEESAHVVREALEAVWCAPCRKGTSSSSPLISLPPLTATCTPKRSLTAT